MAVLGGVHLVTQHVAPPQDPASRVRHRRAGKSRPTGQVLPAVRETLLNLAAAGGAVCILLVILTLIFDMTLIMFKTGSMSPGIPAGSVALVQEIPAADIERGDVVTVDRPDALPITHRVTSVTDAGGDARIITMKGDANLSEDPAPYTVSSVRRVLGSAPGLAPVIVSASEPPVLAGITVVVAGLVAWGSWPTSERQRRPRREAETRRHRRGRS